VFPAKVVVVAQAGYLIGMQKPRVPVKEVSELVVPFVKPDIVPVPVQGIASACGIYCSYFTDQVNPFCLWN
jgi:hypothetical protein